MNLRCLPPERRTLLAFKGPDAARYLNGQMTQDVRELGDSALPSCITDAKGKLQFYVHIFRGPDDSIWVDAPADQREDLEARLTRYLIADDVEVADVSSHWQQIHIPGDAMPPEVCGAFSRRVSRIQPTGHNLWLPVGETLSAADYLTAAEAETLRVQSRIPAWGKEIIPGILPPEAGLDRYAISYRKGCYIGQEVLSRIKTAGRLNRRLAALLIPPGLPVGARLELDGKPVGDLTSIAGEADDSGFHAALGYLGKAAFDASEVAVAGQRAEVVGWA